MAQTTVQNDNAILFGSAKIEIAPYTTGVYSNIGAADGIKFNFKPKFEVIEFDNTEVWKKYANADEATISGTWYELSAENIKKVLGGMANLDTVTADPVLVANEAITLTGVVSQRLAHKNGAGTEVATITVKSESGGGTTYTRAEVGSSSSDYAIAVDGDGYTTIVRTPGSDIASGATVFVNYTYTPAASKTIDVGGITALDFLKIRLTNTRPSDSKQFIVVCHKATIEGDLSWTYGKDGNLKPLGSPFTFKAIKDTTLASGYQLFQIKDEQSVVW